MAIISAVVVILGWFCLGSGCQLKAKCVRFIASVIMNAMTLVDDPNLEKPGPVITLDITGMHCAACVSSVEDALLSSPDVIHARVSLPSQHAVVQLRHEDVNVEGMLNSVASRGYGARQSAGKVEAIRNLDAQYKAEALRWFVRWVSGICLFIITMVMHVNEQFTGEVTWSLCAVIVVVVGFPFFQRAIRLASGLQCSMDTLISIGGAAALAGGAIAYAQQGDVAMALDGALMVSIIAFGNWLESISRRASVSDMVSLGELVPETAVLVRDDSEQVISSVVLKRDDQVVLVPGDRVPCDASVISGESSVDQKWYTGESRPSEVGPGDRILAGASVLDGNLLVRIIETQEKSSMSRVLSLVDQAASASPPIQRFADRVVAVFVPVVLLISLVAFAAWTAEDAMVGLECAIAVLVVACPCALGLATPIAMLVSSSSAARRGILLQEPAALERLCESSVLIFDKTGTLTVGQMQVGKVIACSDMPLEELIGIAAGLEKGSRHPIGKAIVRYAQIEQVEPMEVDTIRLQPGMGVSGFTRKGTVSVGNQRLLDAKGLDLPADLLASENNTLVYVIIDNDVKGVIELSDEIREESPRLVQRLQAMGVRVVLATGDRREIAENVGIELGITERYADLSPEDKHALVNQLMGDGHHCIMVGDGVNDSAAIASATVGIAVADGVELVRYSADIVLTRDGLGVIEDAIHTSKRTMRIIRQNLWWAFAYNMTLIPMAAGLLTLIGGPRMSPFWAAIAMALSSVSVVLNSLRLRSHGMPQEAMEKLVSG